LNFSGIKNIIFDLGGVIINIDFQYTFEAFARLGNTDVISTLKKFESLEVFKRYEKGEFGDEELRDLLRKEFNPDLSSSEIDSAWNALLLDIPIERVRLIQKLKEKYRIFLLSNTNHIHIQEVNKILYRTSGLASLDDLFHKAYCSYKIKMSKPDTEIYEYVLNEQKLVPAETVFIDDNKENITGAQKAGIKTIRVEAPQTITELLRDA
jgi:putative hydrolase of the HAD superfamily